MVVRSEFLNGSAQLSNECASLLTSLLVFFIGRF